MYEKNMEEEMPQTEEAWKKKLGKDKYAVLRQKGTESPFTSPLLTVKEEGIYACAACGAPLFSSNAKFDSGTGWPSFDEPTDKEHVILTEDGSQGMRRIEVTCKNCGSHLGHVFPDGPTPTGKRFCINGCALDFRSTKKSATASVEE